MPAADHPKAVQDPGENDRLGDFHLNLLARGHHLEASTRESAPDHRIGKTEGGEAFGHRRLPA